MSDCRKCASFDWCAENEDCFLFKTKAQPKTEGDKIRAMSDEELAKMIIKYATGHNVDICPETRSNTDCAEQETCVDCWIDWLKQECE